MAELQASAGNFHYVILDTDCNDDSFTAPMEQLEQENVITVIREEAPLPGSNIIVSLSGNFLDATAAWEMLLTHVLGVTLDGSETIHSKRE